MKVKILNNLSYQKLPITDDMIDVDEVLLRRIGIDKQFDENGNVVDYININKIILELTNWFETFFRTQLEQHSWQKDYKPSADPYFKNEDGNPKTYETFEDIIAQAEIVREEIKKLRS